VRFPRKNKAFTLLEVLITIAIISVAVVFIYKGFSVIIAATSKSQDILLACYLAEEKFWEASRNPSVTTAEGQEDMQNRVFKWQYVLEKDPQALDLNELFLTVNWQTRKSTNSLNLDFFSYVK
jgi:type II secretion system protein I